MPEPLPSTLGAATQTMKRHSYLAYTVCYDSLNQLSTMDQHVKDLCDLTISKAS